MLTYQGNLSLGKIKELVAARSGVYGEWRSTTSLLCKNCCAVGALCDGAVVQQEPTFRLIKGQHQSVHTSSQPFHNVPVTHCINSLFFWREFSMDDTNLCKKKKKFSCRVFGTAAFLVLVNFFPHPLHGVALLQDRPHNAMTGPLQLFLILILCDGQVLKLCNPFLFLFCH